MSTLLSPPTAEFTIVLVGNPNVGKSTLFNHLTGQEAVTAHYPGKTAEVAAGITTYRGKKIAVLDLPGIYALSASAEDQRIARRTILETPNAVAVAVVDATNLERNLYVVLQLLDARVPLVVALNLVDEARRKGISVDAPTLARALGTPVVNLQATTGHGIEEILREAERLHLKRSTSLPGVAAYDPRLRRILEDLTARIHETVAGTEPPLHPEALAVLAAENEPDCLRTLAGMPKGPAFIRFRESIAAQVEAERGESLELWLARERHRLAAQLAGSVVRKADPKDRVASLVWRLTLEPSTGVPLLVGTMVALFVLLLNVGNWLSDLIGILWAAHVSPLITDALTLLVGPGMTLQILSWGFDAGTLAILSVGIPYVLVFYLLLAFLEDSGYLNSVAFLLDNVMHRFGLHGQSVVSLVAAAGCNVPAIMGVRSLPRMRERIIASVLVVMVPCSARLAVIFGVVGHYAGWQAALGLVAVVTAIIISTGIALNRIMPGEATGLVMEMFPFRLPSLRQVLLKTWWRVKDFVFVALPIVVLGSLALGALYETGYIWLVAGPLRPVMEGLLGLPVVTGLCLVFAVLRKELAMQLLVAIAVTQYGPLAEGLQFMTGKQIFVYALVSTLYVPCLATVAVLAHNLGWLRVAAVCAFTLAIAIAAGTAANLLLPAF